MYDHSRARMVNIILSTCLCPVQFKSSSMSTKNFTEYHDRGQNVRATARLEGVYERSYTLPIPKP